MFQAHLALSCPSLELAILQRALIPSSGEWSLEDSIWGLNVLIATGVFLLNSQWTDPR